MLNLPDSDYIGACPGNVSQGLRSVPELGIFNNLVTSDIRFPFKNKIYLFDCVRSHCNGFFKIFNHRLKRSNVTLSGMCNFFFVLSQGSLMEIWQKKSKGNVV